MPADIINYITSGKLEVTLFVGYDFIGLCDQNLGNCFIKDFVNAKTKTYFLKGR
ncbi:hypothetical protein [Winogradskyella forsetii]|uniref:hypothetical protein n=1 Tax=Winogradskyella forsetii TaxID=2686077 RepID=UPI0015BF4C30|nr:hypothetical protein [Winogradskyella forsetii]